MPKSKTNMALVPCLYDWQIRWKMLKVMSFKSNSWVDLIVGGTDTLLEMYHKGFLTGQAKQDAKEIYEKKA